MPVLHQSVYISKDGLSSIKYAGKQYQHNVAYKSDCNQNYWEIREGGT